MNSKGNFINFICKISKIILIFFLIPIGQNKKSKVQEKGHKKIDSNNMHEFDEYKDLKIIEVQKEKK